MFRLPLVGELQSHEALLLLGPTGTGKSNMAVDIAQNLGGEIISVDSCAVYQGLDIGSAKPSMAARKAVPHHLIDIRLPDQPYSAGDFFRDSCRLVKEIHERGKIPVLVGGTMMYVNVLRSGLFPIPTISLRSQTRARNLLATKGSAVAHNMLKRQDPVTAAKLKPSDRQRLVRAWEVLYDTGIPLSQWNAREKKQADFTLQCRYVLPRDRTQHLANLRKRFDHMVAAGLVAEVTDLLARYPANLACLRSVGYRQIIGYLQEKYSLSEAVELGVRATKQLAKRQMTWIRKFQPHPDEVLLV